MRISRRGSVITPICALISASCLLYRSTSLQRSTYFILLILPLLIRLQPQKAYYKSGCKHHRCQPAAPHRGANGHCSCNWNFYPIIQSVPVDSLNELSFRIDFHLALTKHGLCRACDVMCAFKHGAGHSLSCNLQPPWPMFHCVWVWRLQLPQSETNVFYFLLPLYVFEYVTLHEPLHYGSVLWPRPGLMECGK